ncbi:peptidase S8/S53 domain-containing protein [Mycena vulgaris]|nr:peptidase S8/S53 domain-containing protein [Mycena vulgaris]
MTTSYGLSEGFFGSSLATSVFKRIILIYFMSCMLQKNLQRLHGPDLTGYFCSLFIRRRRRSRKSRLPLRLSKQHIRSGLPSLLPFVTSVGSTIGFGPEKAVNFTGGGFSNFFSSPRYQAAAVASFLKTVPSDFAGTFNRTGRGYPDVSLQGWNFAIVFANQTFPVSGTSASTPTVAAMIALINDRLITAGKPILGFLNPFIYSKASSAFTDITIGHNSGFSCPASSVAFDAAVGWDPLTGFGTPKFPELLAAAMAY